MEFLARDSLRIVHVEGDDQFAGLSGHCLKLAGFTQPIVRCNDGILALHYFSTIEPHSAPDVILLDLNMPNMNGLEVLHWLRNSHNEQDVAVFFLTSSEEKDDKVRAKIDGPSEFLHKSPLFDELIANLDLRIATINNQRLESARKMGNAMAELAFMGEHASEMIVLIDTRGRIEWVNEPFVRTCGYTAEELRGRKPGMVLRRQAHPETVQMLQSAVQSVHACECRTLNYKKNGTPYSTHISLGPVFNNNRLEGFLAVEKDISEEEQSESALAQC